MKKTVFLIGNGFNNIIANLVRNAPNSNLPDNIKDTQEATADNIIQITKLWEKFDKDFDELAKETGQNNQEELIETIYAVINFFSSLERFSSVIGPERIEELKGLFGNFIVDKIVDIAKDFREHENLQQYKNLKWYFPILPMAVSALLEDKDRKINIYTTNYDGVIDTILSKPYDRTTQTSGFQGGDGFTRRNPFNALLLNFVSEHMDDKQMLIMHMHGSYKFTKYAGMTNKIKGVQENNQPVMVFNRKKVKGRIVKSDNVLSAYFERLRNDVKEAQRFVILGNSMITELHIKEMLKANLSPSTEVVVCSREPHKIAAEIAGFVTNPIIEKSTTGITNEAELIAFFDELIV
jgi:NAD-dependent SIR2 family protein deacetylase